MTNNDKAAIEVYQTIINGQLATVDNVLGKWRLFVPEQCNGCGREKDFTLVQLAGKPHSIRCSCGAEYLLEKAGPVDEQAAGNAWSLVDSPKCSHGLPTWLCSMHRNDAEAVASGQPAPVKPTVDDAMVERACTALRDGKTMRAALVAALGGEQ